MGLHVQICLLGRLRVLFRCVTCSRARSFLRVFSPLPLSCQRIATSPQGGGRFFFFQIKQISYLCFYDTELFLSSLFVEDDVYLRAVLEADYPYRPYPPSQLFSLSLSMSLIVCSLFVLSITLGAGYPVVTKKRRSNVPKRDL